jgi:hypothetical protein
MPDSELRLTIMSSIAQDEVRKTSERVKFGFKRAIEKGVVLGNNLIWGYVKDNGRLVAVEKEAELIRKIFTMYAVDGLGMRSICNWLTESHQNTKGTIFRSAPLRNLTISNIRGTMRGKTHNSLQTQQFRYLDPQNGSYKDVRGGHCAALVSKNCGTSQFILQTRSAAKGRIKQLSEPIRILR